ncbi:MAG TPA: TIGR03557 family F420-dependent LLM class oxidoreductase [Steroidobacteraceae bacterium]|nr:TIGR03557 family F420-dependent LLM class oxidoreductase [Steroidobacteraceae bacterium]
MPQAVLVREHATAFDDAEARMLKLGYKLMTETTDPKALVRNARLAEDAGFDFVGISDHFHPWLESHGHSPFAWSVLGAIAASTSRVGIATGLTCPTMRYHPAIVAQAAATIGVMSDGRFTLAVGSGERLNEHVVGLGWPAVHERQDMLREAIEVIRRLWSGETCTHQGEYYHLDSARLYDLPEQPIPLVVGVSGDKSVQLAAEVGAGIMAVEPKRELVDDWRKAGGDGPRYGEMSLGYATSKRRGLELVHQYMRFGAFDWSVLAELPNVGAFEAASKYVKPKDLQDEIPHGPDVEPYVESVREFVDAGFDHVVLLAVGEDQEAFMRFFERELRDALRALEPRRGDPRSGKATHKGKRRRQASATSAAARTSG